MKKSILTVLTLTAVALMTTPAMAHRGHKGPCTPVWKACVAAGKMKKEAKQCVETIKSGGTVSGVTVSAAEMKACQGDMTK